MVKGGKNSLILYSNARVLNLKWGGRPVDIICDQIDGSIIDIGYSNYVLSRLRGRQVEKIDLECRWVIPGLTDCHTHFVNWCLMLSRPNLRRARTLDDCLRIIKQYISRCRRGEWLIGTGWDRNLWAGCRLPHRSDLDLVAPENPVALWSRDWHTLWLNSLALKKLGISQTTGGIKGGRIERDDKGKLSGILREEAANYFYLRIPPPSVDMALRAIVLGQQRFHALGLTGFHTMEGPQEYGWLYQMAGTGKLKLRGVLYYRQQYLDNLIGLAMPSGFGSRWLKLGGIKLFIDGALGSQTAWLLKPYERSHDRGMAVISRSELASVVSRASRNGLACAVHAIGDAANRLALDVFEDARRLDKSLRHRIEHCQLVRPEDVRRFRRLDIIASVQPSHCPSDLDLIERHWGSRGKYAYPFGSLARSGAMLAFGSDAPIEEPDPWRGIQAAVTRQRIPPDRPPFYPEQKVTVEQAVRAYTIAAAYASSDEGWKGSLEPGKAADFICLSDNIFRMKPEDIHKVRVERTVVGGNTVYKR